MVEHEIICCGRFILDVLCPGIETIPTGDDFERVDEILFTTAGTAAATAVALARLGRQVEAVGVLGNDRVGDLLVADLTAEGVRTNLLERSDHEQTSASIIPVRFDGKRPAFHVVGANSILTAEALPDELLGRSRVLHLGGLGLLPRLAGPAAADVLRRAKELGLITAVDYVSNGQEQDERVLDECYPYIDYIFPNLEDALRTTGAESVAGAAGWFLSRGVQNVIVTLGSDGVSVSTSDCRDMRVEAFPIEMVDSTGCGDAFSAGFIDALLNGAPIEVAAIRGAACGALVATGLGSNAHLSRESVDSMVSDTGNGTSP